MILEVADTVADVTTEDQGTVVLFLLHTEAAAMLDEGLTVE